MILEIREILFGSEDYKRLVALRQLVLREPLGLRYSSEELAAEGGEVHLGAYSGAKLLGCLLLRPAADGKVKMRQVAVDPALQGKGVGKRLVAESEKLAAGMEFREMVLNARETAIAFYQSLGYEIYGEPFEEVGLPHRSMKKRLKPL